MDLQLDYQQISQREMSTVLDRIALTEKKNSYKTIRCEKNLFRAATTKPYTHRTTPEPLP